MNSINQYLKNYKLDFFLFIGVIFSVCLVPFIYFGFLPFAIRGEDLLIPFILFYCLKNGSFTNNIYNKFILIFAAVILLSIIINSRYTVVKDYFEIYKFIKYGIYVTFFMNIEKRYNIMPIINISFITVIIFNLFQYFDILNFNQIIETHYTKSQLEAFYISRRLLGTLGNPNTNAILFLFYSYLYLSKFNESKLYKILFYTSVIFILMCQSRTGFIAFSFSLILFISALIKNKKDIISIVLIVGIIVGFFFYPTQKKSETTIYLQTLAEKNITQKGSVVKRIEIIYTLTNMIKKKPIIGHGPNKDFFYKNNLYSENEYLLYAWRYGVIGLFLYVFWIVMPFLRIKIFNREYFQKNVQLILFSISILICGLTNNPLTEPRLLIIYALSVAIYFNHNKNNLINTKEVE